jgi:hypothetical protein
MIKFSEAFQDWQPIPAWVRFLVSFGNKWPRTNPRPRRISLISMPCDSPAAGLIALGAMVRDLSDPHANDVDGHYDKLLNYARQFLQHCKPCVLKCRPAVKRCGYAKEATGRLRSPLLPHGTVAISEVEQRQIKWIQRDGHRNHVLVIPTSQHAKNYHIDGEPACQWNDLTGELPHSPYQALLDEVTIIPENLRRSYSGLCFAGRITGETASREVCEQVRFSDGNCTYSLRQLLAIHDWSDSRISRMAYFNSRTRNLDRNAATPTLVVADGDVAFLRACDHPEFQNCDVIGVIQRTMEYDRLEAVGIKMKPSLWFAADTDTLCELPSNPKGISIAVLKGRNCP